MSDNIKYSLTSTQFIGEVILSFDQQGYLVMYDRSSAEMSETQVAWLVDELPRRIEDLQKVLGSSKTAKLTEVSQVIDFELFWDRYDEKIRSSRKRTLAKWNKLSKTDQIKAYKFISRYESHLLPGTAKKYASTYLNDELWNN